MLTLNDGRSELWQWDTGRKLTVDADCSQVHFSNKVFGRSIDVDVVDGSTSIPDILLQTDKDLIAWAFVGTAENGYTKISKVFKVNRRNKPADYVFTPPEQTTLAGLVDRLNKIEENQDPDAIKNAVDDYLANNPVRIDEKDPTVSDWAKQPKKPDYTATEVGAVATVNGQTPDKNGNVEIEVSGGNVDQEQITIAINTALAQAKESGEFDGKDGKDYVLTEADKQEIAQEAAELVEVPDVDIPTTLPNPNALTFTGAATGTYDGSAPLTVNIPAGGGGTGGGEKWELVHSLTLAEEVTNIDIDLAFGCSKIIIVLSKVGHANKELTTNGSLFVCFNRTVEQALNVGSWAYTEACKNTTGKYPSKGTIEAQHTPDYSLVRVCSAVTNDIGNYADTWRGHFHHQENRDGNTAIGSVGFWIGGKPAFAIGGKIDVWGVRA